MSIISRTAYRAVVDFCVLAEKVTGNRHFHTKAARAAAAAAADVLRASAFKARREALPMEATVAFRGFLCGVPCFADVSSVFRSAQVLLKERCGREGVRVSFEPRDGGRLGGHVRPASVKVVFRPSGLFC